MWAAGAVAVVAILLAVGVLMLGKGEAPQIDSIAVLPLENLSGDPKQEFFSDGMTEALITDLAKIGALKVISRSSTMRFKGRDESIPEIARLLNVDAVVEGSVLRAGDRVRITAQLIHAETDQHLWAESYERDLRDILALQSEVAREIADEIELTLTPEEELRLASARPVDPEAYIAYTKGRYHWDKRAKEHLEIGLRYFQEAIEKDPSYAAAYAGLADSYSMLSQYGDIPQEEASAKAKAAAERALELDESLAEGHAALGYVLMTEGDSLGAENELERAIELNPGYATAHQYYSLNLFTTGKLDEAIEEVKRALGLDPLSTIININLGRFLAFARRYDEAVDQLQKTLELDSNSYLSYCELGFAYTPGSMHEEAIAAWQKARKLNLNPRFMADVGLAYAYGMSGRYDEARSILKDFAEESETRNVLTFDWQILAHLALGEKDLAMERLEKAFEENEPGLAFILQTPHLDPLRDDPRFQDLLQRMKSVPH
jgi:TolB-like protein/Tfp pilus assembly protein PilF